MILMKIMRLKRRRVILLAGFLIMMWMLIVLLTPPPSPSQSKRRPNRDDYELEDAPRRIRTSAYKGGVGGVGERQNYAKVADFDDFVNDAHFDDFQPDGARNDSIKVDRNLTNNANSNKSALFDIERDLIPKNVNLVKTNPSTLWDTAASWVKSREIYPYLAPQLGDVLQALSTSPIIKADVGYKGTQLKARLVLQGGQNVVFKPKRYMYLSVFTYI